MAEPADDMGGFTRAPPPDDMGGFTRQPIAMPEQPQPSPGLIGRLKEGEELSKEISEPPSKLFGTGGQERYQLWPERLARGIFGAIQSGLTAPRDAWTGKLQVTDPETGMPSREAVERAVDASMVMLPGGAPGNWAATAKFGRVSRGATDGMIHEPVGGIPEHEDFANATKVVINGVDVSDAVKARIKEKIDKLYEDHGIHPAEVAHDAEIDPQVAQALKSGGDDLPWRYVAPKDGIKPPSGSTVPLDTPRSVLGKTGQPHIDDVLDNPVVKDVINNPVIDSTKQIPNSAGGSTPLNNPKMYIHKDFPRSMTVDGVTFDPADAFTIHENVEEFVIDVLMKNGWDRGDALKAAFHVWGEPAEDAFYRAHGMDPAKVEAAYKDLLDKFASEKVDSKQLPSDLFTDTYTDGSPLKSRSGPIGKPTPEEAAEAKRIVAGYLKGEGPRITGDVDIPQLPAVGGGGKPPAKPPGGAGVPATTPPPGDFASAQQAILDKISIGEADPSRKWTWGRLYTNVVDKMFPIAQAVKKAGGQDLLASENPYQLARLLSGVAGKANHMLERGTFDFNTYAANGPSLRAILEPVKGDLNGFRAFATAARARELELRGMESGFDKDAVQIVGAEGMKNKVYMETLQKLVKYQNNMAAYLRDSGVLSTKAYDAMLEANKVYVPFNRVMGDPETGVRGVGSLQARNPIKAIKGSDLDIIDPIENVIRNTYLFTTMAEKNAVGQSLVRMLEKGDGKPPSNALVPIDSANRKAVTEWLGRHGSQAPDDLVSVLEEAAESGQELRPGEIRVFQDGIRKTYKVDPDLAIAMKGLDSQAVGMLEKMLSIPATTLRAGATTTPDFALRHSIRDYLYAAMTSKGFFSPIDMAKGFIGLIAKDNDFWNWMKGGGGNVSMVALDRRYLQEDIAKLTDQTGLGTRAWNVVADPNASWLQKGGAVAGLPFRAASKYVIHPLQVLTELAEGASHLGAFKKAMREQMPSGETLPAIPGQAKSAPSKATIQDAAWTSRATAVDAARIGASTRAYNMITAFANITIQDSDRMIRAFKDDPTGTALKVGAAVVAPSALLYFANKDDPRYGEIPQWQKDLFWIVMTKDYIFRIPKPFGVGQVFGSGTERTLEAFSNANPEAFRNWSKSIADSIVPQFYPTAAAPVIEQFANRSTFTNRTLIPDSLEKQLPEYQYTPYTTELTKSLGRLMSSFPGMRETSITPETLGGGPARAVTSPILIENYIRGWSGNLGIYALNTADLALRKAGVLPDPPKPASTLADIPVIRAFTVRYPTATAQSIQDFYDRYETNNKFYNTLQAKAKDGDAEAVQHIMDIGGPRVFMRLNEIKSVLSEHSQLIRDVWKDPNSNPAEKRQLIDQLYYSMIEIGQAGKQSMKDIDEALAKKNP